MADVVSILTEIFRVQGKIEVAEVFEQASARIEEISYDKWNGGTCTWALRLKVPVALFGAIEPSLAGIEKDIREKLPQLDREHTNDNLNDVSISPIAPGDDLSGQTTPPKRDVQRIWPGELFPLFLSHVAAHRVAISKLSKELEHLGVKGFVAHEDIKPSLEWIKEIELALKTMHALGALVTSEFHDSLWTDQEVGWALGRGVPLVPVWVGAEPYGFAGHIQGVRGALENPKELASSIVETLLQNPRTHHEMRRALTLAFRDASSDVTALALRDLILDISDFTDSEKLLLRTACVENPNVRDAFNVPEAIYGAVGRPPENPPIAAADDDIPF